MNASFISIGQRARLPWKLLDNEHDELWTGRDGWYDRAYELRNWWINGTPLKDAPWMVWWDMNNTVADASFHILTPENFSENPAIIVPPQWISLNRNLEGRWHVKRVQAILEFIAENNSYWKQEACLGALIHERKIREIRSHIERAWYSELWMKWECYVFVHRSTLSVEQILANTLKMK
jgi:hypothetical protein